MSLMDQRSARLRAADQSEPLLEVDDIQGNILSGFNKDHQTLVAFRIDDAEATRRWLQRVTPTVASAAEVLAFNDLFRRLRSRRGADPQGFVATWVNIAFSAAGLRKLLPPEEVDTIPDVAFRIGMLERSAAILRDPTTPGAPGAPDTWKVGGPDNEADVLVVVASDLPHEMRRMADWIVNPADGESAPAVLYREEGSTRPDMPGHEHFGFKDGVSQPAVRGRISENPDVLLEPRLIDPAHPDAQHLARPGQPLLWPGLFVFGYPTQHRETGEPFDPGHVSPDWLRNGSMLVFRRLRQDVAAFRAFVEESANRIAQQPGFAWVTPALFAALMVGRWPSGVALSRAPDADPGSTDSLADNHFLWEHPVTELPLRPQVGHPGPVPEAPADVGGHICPHASHIRKVNPRDQDTEFGTSFDTLTRRMLRRGIPFGPPLPHPAPAVDEHERGLLFLCYQRSIAEQFELTSENWANGVDTPKPGGHDPIIGQTSEAAQRQRTFEIKDRESERTSVTVITKEWVITTGGGYFFAPSLKTLRHTLAGLA